MNLESIRKVLDRYLKTLIVGCTVNDAVAALANFRPNCVAVVLGSGCDHIQVGDLIEVHGKV